MAKNKIIGVAARPEPVKHVTSIGSSSLTRPKNKSKRRSQKNIAGRDVKLFKAPLITKNIAGRDVSPNP
jgi:hypothetical protein